ncbi:MAG TPA: ATP-dependent DNA helicase RecG [Candidatus Acidoferrales bacterium]|nr:ATP-dependent DNA helicase RecG [Candidatus Acidoferrales bacterium]
MTLLLSTEVKYLKGVGPQRAVALAERGILTVEDLLYRLPFRYEDRIHFTSIGSILPGNVYTLKAEVADGSLLRFRGRRDAIYHLLVQDASGVLHVKFFHGSYLEGRFRPGQRIVLHGKAEHDRMRPARLEMTNPQFELLGSGDGDSTEVGRIVPIYEAIGPLTPRVLRRLVHTALEALGSQIPDLLPADLLERLALPPRGPALAAAHFPPPSENLEQLNAFQTPAQRRLIFEEFFLFQLGLALRRRQAQAEPGIAFRVRDDRIRQALKNILPFKPTSAQKRVLAEIAADLERPQPMNRLLQGDVGSGKTIVALEAAVIVIENGYQVALMAPTEILAVQHYLAARRVLGRGGYQAVLLVSGMKPAAKREALERLRRGEAQFAVGTHALLEDPVEFANLGLAIIDEQHRFGVLQRKRLREKGAAPDVLVMTATPIPRTLALTVYGDLDLSVIDEMPPGRGPMKTLWRSEPELAGVWEFVRREVRGGRQAYVVYPVVEESKRELKAAIAQFERLSKMVFPELRVGLLHGRMTSEEKDAVMEQFRTGQVQVLVATTVIEVGVDVPNASIMVIEHAERFGLAQLHQLRGRIGRGPSRSYCVLVAPKDLPGDARERLETLVRTTNGSEIADVDLKLRGPGEFFGTAQHGSLALRVANLLRDHDLLESARREAFAFVEDPGRSAQLQRLLAGLRPGWERHYELAKVG